LHSVPASHLGLQDIELARISQEVAERRNCGHALSSEECALVSRLLQELSASASTVDALGLIGQMLATLLAERSRKRKRTQRTSEHARPVLGQRTIVFTS
jgi:hypothetical protein